MRVYLRVWMFYLLETFEWSRIQWDCSAHRPLPIPNVRQYAANALKAGKYLRINVLNVNASIYSWQYLIRRPPKSQAKSHPRPASRMSFDKWLDK